MLVSEYMTPNPLVVQATEPVEQIADLIRRHGIRQVPVVDDSNRLIGIVTDRDIRSATGYEGRSDLCLVAEDIMTPDPVTVIPGADVCEAIDTLRREQFGALPVVVGEHVVGMIGVRELLHLLREQLAEPAAEPARRLCVEYEPDIF
jgi:acetoin utilization protein AcuB